MYQIEDKMLGEILVLTEINGSFATDFNKAKIVPRGDFERKMENSAKHRNVLSVIMNNY